MLLRKPLLIFFVALVVIASLVFYFLGESGLQHKDLSGLTGIGNANNRAENQAETQLATKPRNPSGGNRDTPPQVDLLRDPGGLIQGYVSSRDNLGYIKFAKQNVAAGGYYMALIAAMDCENILLNGTIEGQIAKLEGKIPVSATDRHMRLWAATNYFERCSAYSKNKLSSKELGELANQGRALGDPIFRLKATLSELSSSQPLDQTSWERVANGVLDSGNPFAIDMLMTRLSGNLEAFPLYLDGKAISADDALSFRRAAGLVPCYFGLPCGSNNPGIALPCAQTGDCDIDNLYQPTQRYLSPYEFEQIMAFHNQLADILKNRRWDKIKFSK